MINICGLLLSIGGCSIFANGMYRLQKGIGLIFNRGCVCLIAALKMTLFILFALNAMAQGNPRDTTTRLIIENADLQELDLRESPSKQYLIGNVRIFHRGTFFYCDTAILQGKKIWAKGEVAVLKQDGSNIFSDSIHYDGDNRIAYLDGRVVVEKGVEKLYGPHLTYDVGKKVGTFDQKIQLFDGTYTIKSQSGKFDENKGEAYFYNTVSIQGDSFQLTNDTLIYKTRNKNLEWSLPTWIEDKEGHLYSEKGRYSLETKSGTFAQKARYYNDTMSASADTITIDKSNNLIQLAGNSIYISKSDTAKANIITYEDVAQIITLSGNAQYSSPSSKSTGDVIIYNKISQSTKVSGRGKVADPPTFIAGDDIDYNREIKSGLIIGNVIWEDTTEKSIILCDTLIYRGSEDYAKAIGSSLRPLLISYQEAGDSLFMSADTLISFSKINIISKKSPIEPLLLDSANVLTVDSLVTDTLPALSDSILLKAMEIVNDTVAMDTIHYFEGIGDVQVWHKDYSVRSAHVLYSELDSTFTFEGGPRIWQDTTQMYGDTLVLKMQNNSIEWLKIKNNAMIINSTDLIFFNQIQGDNILAEFENKKLQKMKVNGNSKNIYYLLDDNDAYIGVNQTKCSFIIYLFAEDELETIQYYTSPVSSILPIEGTDHEAIRLEGYKWLPEARPLDRYSIRLFVQMPIEPDIIVEDDIEK